MYMTKNLQILLLNRLDKSGVDEGLAHVALHRKRSALDVKIGKYTTQAAARPHWLYTGSSNSTITTLQRAIFLLSLKPFPITHKVYYRGQTLLPHWFISMPSALL